jgi:hypothetical protein
MKKIYIFFPFLHITMTTSSSSSNSYKQENKGQPSIQEWQSNDRLVLCPAGVGGLWRQWE